GFGRQNVRFVVEKQERNGLTGWRYTAIPRRRFATIIILNNKERGAMETVDEILPRAQQRAEEMGLAYEGALLPVEAQAVLTSLPQQARLVDVRCKAELDWVGRIPGAIEVELRTYPGMQPNPDFVEQLTQQVADDAVLLFIC